MMSSKTVNATLKLNNEYAVNIVLDWFGINARIYQKDGDIFADVDSNETALVYWCLQYADHVMLISPNSTKEKIKSKIQNLNKIYK